eukprot:363897-Chlamydomonas_euryale.AAC.11
MQALEARRHLVRDELGEVGRERVQAGVADQAGERSALHARRRVRLRFQCIASGGIRQIWRGRRLEQRDHL